MKLIKRGLGHRYDYKFWTSVFTLIGTIIGAGILGLPYVFSRAGFWVGVFWLVILGIIMLFVNLYLGEVVLRTQGVHQLTGYAKKYLGKLGKNLMFFAMVFGIYSALIAYLIGEGESFSYIFTGTLNYSIWFGIAFWLAMTFLLREGLRGLRRVEFIGVLVILIVVVIIGIYFAPDIKISNLTEANYSLFFLPLGVVLFALLGFSSIPEARRLITRQEKNFKKIIILGSLIPVIIYFLFPFIFVGVLGNGVAQVSTISLGKLVTFFGIFTMLTSYFVLSFALRDMFIFDFHYNKKKTFILTSIFPLILYLGVSYFSLLDFVKVLGIGGVISGGLTGILILLMNKKAKIYGNRKPEFWIPLNWLIIIILNLVFILGVVVEVLPLIR